MKPGLKAAQLSCTGGTVTAQAHKVLQQLWGSKLPKKGVVWTDDKECRPADTGCLITKCGQSDALFVNTQVTAVKTAPGAPREQGDTALCISQGSKVTLRNCAFTSSSITPLAAYDSDTSVLLDGCSVSNNKMDPPRLPSGVYLEDGSILVRSSKFLQNKAYDLLGSTITAKGDGRIAIVDSTFTGNQGWFGGALYVLGNAQAIIQGSHFEANMARSGGAICANNQARSGSRVGILPGEHQGFVVPATHCMNGFPCADCHVTGVELWWRSHQRI